MATGKTWSIAVPITKEGGTWGYITVYFQEDYDTLANTSTLKVTKMTGSNSIRAGNFYSAGSIAIDGSTWYSWTTGDWTFAGLSGEKEFVTYSGASYPSGKVINHNDDGSKTINISVTVSSYYGSSPTWTGSGGTVTNSIALTAIPRASSIVATDANIGAVSQITVTRKATMYTHTIGYAFGSLTGYIDASGAVTDSAVKMDTTSIGFTIPTTFYGQIPNAKTGVCTLTITTYSDSIQIGSAQTCTFTVTAAEANCTPTVSGTVVDTNEATIALTGDENILVRYMSDALCTISAEAKNSASISTKTIAGVIVTENAHTITGIETDTVTFGATDSRGYSNSVDVTKSFISYIKLTNNSTAARPDPTSGKVTLTITGSCFNGSFGAVTNAVTATYSIDGGTPVATTVTMSGNAYSVTLNLTGFDYQSSYSIEVVVSDKLMTVSRTLPIQKGIPVFDWGEDDFRFNVPAIMGAGITTYSDPTYFGSAFNDTMASLFSALPVNSMFIAADDALTGSGWNFPNAAATVQIIKSTSVHRAKILLWGKRTSYGNYFMEVNDSGTPTGSWVNMALASYPVGSIYISSNSTSPAALFGGTWEAITDRVIVGAGGSYAVDSTGGEAEHTLTIAEMPSHQHRAAITHADGDYTNEGISATLGAATNGYRFRQYTSASGGGQAHNNMQPYIAKYIWERVE